MKEQVLLSCTQQIADITEFLRRSGKYIDAGYVLDTFKVEGGLEAVFTPAPPKTTNPIGFVDREEIKTDD